MSIKKYAPYRLDKANKDRFGKKNQEKLKELRSKIVEGVRVMNDNVDPVHKGVRPKKRKGKKERKKMKDGVAIVDGDADIEKHAIAVNVVAEGHTESKKRKRERNSESHY